MQWLLHLLLLGLLIGVAAGCSHSVGYSGASVTPPGMERRLVHGAGFDHLAYSRGLAQGPGRVHVYLEGDGLPWRTRNRIATDPTPRVPLALRLMARDPTPSLYLGRPCYHGLAQSRGCSPWLWTQGRYSESVVSSMTAALQSALGEVGSARITLIGYSGGGVLAMLIAPRLEKVEGVVTIAANLDIDAWTDHHNYSRLRGSINPAAEPPLPERIRQIHLAGGRDLQVPARLSIQTAARQPNIRWVLVPGFDHGCCWEQALPEILAALHEPDSVLDPDSLRLMGATEARDR